METREREALDLVLVHGLFASKAIESSAGVWDKLTDLISVDHELQPYVRLHLFNYASPIVQPRPDRRIPAIVDVADQLETFYANRLAESRSVVMISHSQGGLVIQRFLARRLEAGEGRSLAAIQRIIFLACPNFGSDFLFSLRRALGNLRNPQVRELAPITREVIESQRVVVGRIQGATRISEVECPITIWAYSGSSDNVVSAQNARGVFQHVGTLPGDHFSIAKPSDEKSESFLTIKKHIQAVLTGAAVGSREVPGAADVGDDYRDAVLGRPGNVSVEPPFGRRSEGHLRGREEIIHAVLARSDAREQVHVLAGLGGSGKTRLALEIADRAVQERRDVWWVNMTRLNSGMREVAGRLGASESQVATAWKGDRSATDLVWNLLQAKTERWVLVLDNADNPEALGPADGALADGTGWLRPPANRNGTVVVTSRDRSRESWGPWSAVHDVRPLDEDDGASMLMELTDNTGGTFDAAQRLSGALGGLPLALSAAASYIKSVSDAPVWNGRAAIADFDTYRAAVQTRFAAPFGEQRRELTELLGETLIREVATLSLELLAERGLSQAALILRLTACFHIAPIPYHVLLDDSTIASSRLFSEFTSAQHLTVLSGLAGLGLIELAVHEGVADEDLAHVLSVHPVLHGILRADADASRRPVEYYELAIRLLQQVLSDRNPDYAENWEVWNLLAPHTLEVARSTVEVVSKIPDHKVIEAALSLARFTARYLLATGLVSPADDLISPLIANCASFGFSRDDPAILALRHEHGRVLLARGDAAGAEAEFTEVLEERRRRLPPNHPDTLATDHKLARSLLEQERWVEAEQRLRAIVEAEEHVRGLEHSDTIVVRHSLARAVLAQADDPPDRPDRIERAAEAEALVREVLEVCYRKWSLQTAETVWARQTLANCLLAQERVEDAEMEVRAALATISDRQQSPDALKLRRTLAFCMIMQNRRELAIAELGTLVDDWTKILGAGHPDTVQTIRLLEKVRSDMPPDSS